MEELGLEILIDLMEPCNIWSSVTDHDIGFLALEMGQNFLERLFSGDISL
jgi:hypothetical protein